MESLMGDRKKIIVKLIKKAQLDNNTAIRA